MTRNKIQSLLVEHLLKHGQIELSLPDGVVLEIGLTQEDAGGRLVIKDDYCWVIASQGGRSASIDNYNLGVRFGDDDKVLVFDDRFPDRDSGDPVRRLDVV